MKVVKSEYFPLEGLYLTPSSNFVGFRYQIIVLRDIDDYSSDVFNLHIWFFNRIIGLKVFNDNLISLTLLRD